MPTLPALSLLAFSLLALSAGGLPAQAKERLAPFAPADRPALQAWDGLLRQDKDLAESARRHRFVPRRDLTMLRIDLDGDRRPELILYAELMDYCGSAGCVIRVLTQRPGGWALACETHADGPLVVDDARSAGWRRFRATYRMTWEAAASRPAGITCVEGEVVDRAQQGRIAR